MAEPLRVIVLKDGDVFYAQCLEIDIAAQGQTEAEALSRLEACLHAEIKIAKENGTKLNDIGPAPEAFHAIYGANVVGRTEMKLVA